MYAPTPERVTACWPGYPELIMDHGSVGQPGSVVAPLAGGAPTGGALPDQLAAATVFLAAAAVLVLEIAGLRLVAPYLGVTLQTSSAVIGIALGAIAYGAW